MPVVKPLDMSEIDAESRERIEAGLRTGMYTMTLPLQIVAHAPAALRAMDEGYKAMFRRSILDDRLSELLRLLSARLNGCAPCSQSRKDDTISEDDVACLIEDGAGDYTPRERLALDFMKLMCLRPHDISADTYLGLSAEFSTPEIVELGWTCSQYIAGHRFMHSLDILGDAPPVLT